MQFKRFHVSYIIYISCNFTIVKLRKNIYNICLQINDLKIFCIGALLTCGTLVATPGRHSPRVFDNNTKNGVYRRKLSFRSVYYFTKILCFSFIIRRLIMSALNQRSVCRAIRFSLQVCGEDNPTIKNAE